MRRIALALLIIFAVLQWRYLGPAPARRNAPASEFSATRAFDTLRHIGGDDVPHPIGLPEHDLVRDRIAAAFRSLGYTVRVEQRFACDAQPVCATVANIIATPPGAPNGPAVVLAAHYDSVPAGPGASDDGVSVASLLEVARAVRNERTRNPLMFLIDDGEEAGLLGAEAFVADPAVQGTVGAVINAEARGTAGPSYLFETSRRNAAIAPLVYRALPRPITSSVFPAIYDLLPNDTDLTVFKRNGISGVNFAFIRNVAFYHTPLDDTAHVSLRTVQHHGDNLLAAARALENAPLPLQADHDEIWFDVLSFFVVSWLAPWSLAITIAALVVALIAAALLMRGQRTSASEVALGLVWVIASIVAAAVLGFMIGQLAAVRSHVSFAVSPFAELAAVWIGAALSAAAIRTAFGKRIGSEAMLSATAIVFSLLAIVTCFLMVGASYFFIVPALVLAACSWFQAAARIGSSTAALLGTIAAAIVFLPMASQLYAALGRTALPAIAVVVVFVVLTALPASSPPRPALLGVMLLSVIVLTAAAIVLPAVTAERPARNSLTYLDDGAQHRWVAGNVSPALRAAATFERTRALFPWSHATPYAAPAPGVALPRVDIQAIPNGDGRITFRVQSRRNAQRVVLLFRSPSPLEDLRVDGVTPPPRPQRFRPGVPPPWHRVVVRSSAMTVEVALHGGAPSDVYALDYSYGLPAAGRLIANARDASHQVPSDDGDVTITMARLK